MKKTNSKTKLPTPATTVAAKPTKKKASIEPTAKPTVAVNGDASNHALASAPLATATTAVAIAPSPATRVRTKIVARADIGYGNVLYVRGDGPGLSWNQGVPMECVANDQWEINLGESPRPISFKVLLNDATWCTGPDTTVISGSTATVTPEFV